MTETFDRCFGLLIGHEGGYVDNPLDPGGETKYGISKRSFPEVNIAALTIDDAKALYRAHYWNPIRGDELSPRLALMVFDSAVNNGTGQAILWLQQAAGVRPDGKLGPMTLSAARAPGVASLFHLIRVRAMTRMPGWQHFGGGWAVRLVTLAFQAQEMADV